MKATLAVLLPLLLGLAACAQAERVEADPDEIEAAVEKANEGAAASRDERGA